MPVPAMFLPTRAASITTNLVTVAPTPLELGHDCLAVELYPAEQALRLAAGRRQPASIAIVAPAFADGAVGEAWSGGRELTGRSAPDDRGFVGLSFHIGGLPEPTKTVYLRMTNGRLNVPPPPPPAHRPRHPVCRPIRASISPVTRALPGSATREPTSRSAAGTACARVRAQLLAPVGGVEALAIDDLRFPGWRGPVGLFVSDGSRGYFRDVVILSS